jgi:Skp family chaperone for outer membrane proteins
MRELLPLVAVSLMLVPTPASAQATASAQPESRLTVTRLGCFSLQRAFSESAEGKAGIARLSALQEKRAREIAEKNKALQAQEAALQASLTVLGDDARSQKSRELEKFRIDVQRFIQDAQAEVTGAQREMEISFIAKLRPAVERVAKDQGLQMVVNLDDPSVVWSDPGLDITGDVIKLLAQK